MLVEFVSHVDVGRLDGGEDQLSNTCTHGVKYLFFTVRTRGNIPLTVHRLNRHSYKQLTVQKLKIYGSIYLISVPKIFKYLEPFSYITGNRYRYYLYFSPLHLKF